MPNGEPTEGAPGGGATLEGKLGIFDSVGSSLESLVEGVKAIPKVAKEAAYYTYYTAKATLGLAAGVAMAGPAALMLPFGMMAGRYTNDIINKKEKKFKERFKEFANVGLVGGILGGYLGYIFKATDWLGNLIRPVYGKIAALTSKALVGLVNIIPFLYAHEYLDRLFIKDYKPKPVLKKIKENKGKLGLLSLPIMANYSITPLPLQLPVAGAISWLYGGMTGEKKKEEKTSPQVAQTPAGYGQRPAA